MYFLLDLLECDIYISYSILVYHDSSREGVHLKNYIWSRETQTTFKTGIIAIVKGSNK